MPKLRTSQSAPAPLFLSEGYLFPPPHEPPISPPSFCPHHQCMTVWLVLAACIHINTVVYVSLLAVLARSDIGPPAPPRNLWGPVYCACFRFTGTLMHCPVCARPRGRLFFRSVVTTLNSSVNSGLYIVLLDDCVFTRFFFFRRFTYVSVLLETLRLTLAVKSSLL